MEMAEAAWISDVLESLAQQLVPFDTITIESDEDVTKILVNGMEVNRFP